MTDTIADLLTRIRNASRAKKEVVTVPYSRTKHEIVQKLIANNYLKKVSINKDGKFDILEIELDPERNDLTLVRVSKCGQRIYKKATALRRIKNGLGVEIISTSQGILTNIEAKEKNLGGEVICIVY